MLHTFDQTDLNCSLMKNIFFQMLFLLIWLLICLLLSHALSSSSLGSMLMAVFLLPKGLSLLVAGSYRLKMLFGLEFWDNLQAQSLGADSLLGLIGFEQAHL